MTTPGAITLEPGGGTGIVGPAAVVLVDAPPTDRSVAVLCAPVLAGDALALARSRWSPADVAGLAAFAWVSLDPTARVLLLHGDLRATATTADGATTDHGTAEPGTWSEVPLDPSVVHLRLWGPATGDGTALELRTGVAPAGVIEVTLPSAIEPPVAVPAPPASVPPTTSAAPPGPRAEAGGEPGAEETSYHHLFQPTGFLPPAPVVDPSFAHLPPPPTAPTPAPPTTTPDPAATRIFGAPTPAATPAPTPPPPPPAPSPRPPSPPVAPSPAPSTPAPRPGLIDRVPGIGGPPSAPAPPAAPVAPAVPITPIPAPPAPVAPIPVAPAPVAPIPVPLAPATPIPVAPTPALPPPVGSLLDDLLDASQPPAPPPPPAPARAAELPAVEPPLDQASDEGLDEATISLAALRAARAAAVGPKVPDVVAVFCPVGHPNPTHADRCRVCDEVVVDRSSRTIPRPSLGVLRFDDGLTVDLDRHLLLGRNPATDLLVRDEPTAVIRLEDPDSVLSRTHAIVQLDGWHVRVIDRDSMNHTYVQLPDGDPVQIPSGTPYPLSPGAVVRLGDEVAFTYEVPRP